MHLLSWIIPFNTSLTKPLTLGADVVLHSATKFLSGHSDVIAGVAVVKDAELAKQIGYLQNSFGAVLGVQDCWLLLRGIKTLHVRMKHSSEGARMIAEHLQNHPLIKKCIIQVLKIIHNMRSKENKR